MKTKFFSLSQNNSGGSFDTNDKLCHRLVIEAKDESHAISIAENLGCYWNGVDAGIDCGCCGDRWYASADEVEVPTTYAVSVYDHYDNPEEKWHDKYDKYPLAVKPTWEEKYGTRAFKGVVSLPTLELYCQFWANEYGHTTPDIRVFYLDGTVKEYFMQNSERPILK